MKTPGVIAIVVGTILLIGSAKSQDEAGPNVDKPLVEKTHDESPQADAVTRIKELQTRRVATLKKLANLVSEEFKRGLASPFVACDAQLQALEAQADAAESDAERIKYLEDCVNFAKEYEKLADALRTSARRNYTDIVRLQARRLEAEINLELARTGETHEHHHPAATLEPLNKGRTMPD